MNAVNQDLTPRTVGRRLIAYHGTQIPRRCLATEIESNEAALEQQLREAASLANGGTPTPQQTQSPRRRRRRKDAEPARDPIVESYLAHQHMQKTTAPYGSSFQPLYQPHTLLANPPSPSDVTLELLMSSQTHLGHSTSLWNPANSRYIFGIRSGIHIISLDTTAQYLRRAAKVVSGVAERGGLILFVGTRPGFDRCVVRAAQLAAPACHLFERWTPGSITNSQQILGRCGMRVVDEFDSEIDGFEDQLSDRNALKPDLVICLNPLENRVLLHECALATIPTIGIIDTDADPTHVTYPIPANDDSIRSVQAIAGVLGRAGEEGQKKRRTAAIAGKITYNPAERLALPDDFDQAAFKAAREGKKAAFASGIADMRLLSDPALGGAMSKLSDTEKRMLAEGDDSIVLQLDSRLNPQERSAIRSHVQAQTAMREASEKMEAEAKKAKKGSAKDRARAAAAAAAGVQVERDEDDEEYEEDEEDEEESDAQAGTVYEASPELGPEEVVDMVDEEPDLPRDASDPVEASRRGAAAAFFADSTSAENSPSVEQSDDAQDEADFINVLTTRLSEEEIDALRDGPTQAEMQTIRGKLKPKDFETLVGAMRKRDGEENVNAEPTGYANAGGYDPEAGSRDYFQDDYGDVSGGQMGYNESEEVNRTEKDAERAGLGNADDSDPDGTSSRGR